MYKLLLVSLSLILSACAEAPTQAVLPVPAALPKNICIIDNPKVDKGLLQLFENTLAKKGYSVRIILKESGITECPVSATYVAYKWWDVKTYLSKVEINVYSKGLLIGRATYNANEGSTSKYHDAESTMSELVNKLFP